LRARRGDDHAHARHRARGEEAEVEGQDHRDRAKGEALAPGTQILSVPGAFASLPVCGEHYRLQYRADHQGGGFNSGSDCKLDGFNVTIAGSQAGDTITVQVLLPPNSCG
jgi:hypothetical protein